MLVSTTHDNRKIKTNSSFARIFARGMEYNIMRRHHRKMDICDDCIKTRTEHLTTALSPL